MISRRRVTVSASALFQSGFKERLDFPDQRLERQLLHPGARGDLFSVFALTLRKQLARDPWSGARVPEPVDVEAGSQLLVQDGLQLPGPEISGGIVPWIDIHKRIGGIVFESGGIGE